MHFTCTTHRYTLFALLGLAVLLSGCASDEQKITNKIQLELDSCKAASGDTYDVKFQTGKTYALFKSKCDTAITEVNIVEQLSGSARVGPYHFKLRKNSADNRWTLTQITWPELDEARSIFTFTTISKTDYARADELLAKVNEVAPELDEAWLLRMDIALKRRGSVDKKKDPDPTGLGKAQDFYQKAIAAAKGNPNFEAKVRMKVLAYYDDYRRTAEDNSTPSETAAEYEQGAIKAVRLEAEEAKKAGKKDLYKKKMAEIEVRQKEAEENIVIREKEAKRMAGLAVTLKKRQCTEIGGLKAITVSDTTLAGKVSEHTSLNCP